MFLSCPKCGHVTEVWGQYPACEQCGFDPDKAPRRQDHESPDNQRYGSCQGGMRSRMDAYGPGYGGLVGRGRKASV